MRRILAGQNPTQRTRDSIQAALGDFSAPTVNEDDEEEDALYRELRAAVGKAVLNDETVLKLARNLLVKA